MKTHKNVYIISGPNGSGKTTFAREFLPNYAKCPNFINSDFIAQGLSPFSPGQVAIKAGKLVLQQIKEFTQRNVDFGFETTLAGKTYLRYFQDLKEKGYKLHLFFLWIPDAEFSRSRVRERAKSGGHDIPDETICRRYPRVIHNFVKIYIPLCDKVVCYSNSGLKPIPVFEQDGRRRNIFIPDIYERILRQSDDYKATK